MTSPNFFLVGAPKCGTTALYHYLAEHPHIFLPHVKEPHYFANELYRWPLVKTESEYLKLFDAADPEQTVVGEGSVFYLFSGDALERIREFQPDARIIAMVRNPVDMVYSLHAQMVHAQNEDVSDFEMAWRLQAARKDGKQIPARSRTPAMLQYAEVGKMGRQMQRLLDIFPADQVKVIVFDDFKSDTKGVYEGVLEFLGLESDGRDEFPRINANKGTRSAWINRLIRRPPLRVDKILERVKVRLGIRGTNLGSWLLRLNTTQQSRPKLSVQLRRELVNTFRDDVELLAKLLDRDLSHWLS